METFIKRIALIVAMLLTISDFAMAEPHAYYGLGLADVHRDDLNVGPDYAIGQDVGVGASAGLPWGPYYPDNPSLK